MQSNELLFATGESRGHSDRNGVEILPVNDPTGTTAHRGRARAHGRTTLLVAEANNNTGRLENPPYGRRVAGCAGAIYNTRYERRKMVQGRPAVPVHAMR
jgi:hypothetical protein